MGPAGAPAHADAPEERSRGDSLTHPYPDSREVGVERAHTCAMRDAHHPPPAAGIHTGERNPSPCCGLHPRAERREVVHAGVKAISAWTEAVTDRRADGRGEPDRRPWQRGMELRDRLGAGRSVGLQPGPCLKEPERCVRVRPETSVERSGRKAVPGERELQRRNVPALRARTKHSSAQWSSSAVWTQERQRSPARLAVGGEPGPTLKASHGAARLGAKDTIGRSGIEPLLPQPDLKRGRLRVSHLRGLRDRHRARAPRHEGHRRGDHRSG